MKNPVNRDDFENYLENEVNQHRMYPSDHVWRNIQQDLHGYKKWPALTVITLFVISALVVGTVLIKPQYKTLAAATNNIVQQATENTSKQPQENLQEHLSPEHITQQTIARVTENIDITDNIQTAFASYTGIADLMPVDNTNNTVATIADNTVASPQKTAVKKDFVAAAAVNPPGVNWMRIPADDALALDGQVILPNSGNKNAVPNNGFMFSLFDKQSSNAFKGINLENAQNNHNSFKFKPNSRRFDFAFYAAPSISYRRLAFNGRGTTNHTYVSGLPVGADYTVDLNRAIQHKPAVGYEVGATLGYKINKVLTLRTGFQFNMREYDIEAYKRNYTASDIVAYNSAISGSLDVSGQTVATVNENDKTILRNRYYEISMPIGVDVKAWSYGRFSVGFAVAVQPTYIFDKDPFIITSDYKNYIDGATLVRNWNINANAETYVGYTTGKFRWQIGPQFRYQVLSTLNGSYPIREHLVDYGVKIGFVKSFP